MIAREYTKFISEFVSHPRAVGAFAPSSANLARHLVSSVDWPNTSTVVEYGPGTGVITEEIIAQLPPAATFLAIEISSRFAEMLRGRFPDIRVCEGSVAMVKDHCEANGVEVVDAIVSGLPWAVFSDEDQTTFLDATMEVLRPGGQFITHDHTMAHWRELWTPQIFDRQRLDRWEKQGSKDVNARLRERTIAIMEEHEPEPLAASVEQEIEAILKA